MRHDYGLSKDQQQAFPFPAGMTEEERKSLWYEMAQLYDNCIAPYMEFK
jgi:hypothetical protein